MSRAKSGCGGGRKVAQPCDEGVGAMTGAREEGFGMLTKIDGQGT